LPRAAGGSISGHVALLQPGRYEYPFTFKVPLNNFCSTSDGSMSNKSTLTTGNFAAHAITNHIKAGLPPTLSNFPGMADIEYYIKVTVHRKEFYKENPRTVRSINPFPVVLL